MCCDHLFSLQYIVRQFDRHQRLHSGDYEDGQVCDLVQLVIIL